MKWPLVPRAVPDRLIPLYDRLYLHAASASKVDPNIIWGTEVDADALESFLRRQNENGKIVVTVAHALVRATALALQQFPEMNVRVVGHRLYVFRKINIRIPFFHRRNKEIDLLLIEDANLKSLEQIATEVWHRILEAGRGEGSRERKLARLRQLSGFWLRQTLRVYGFMDRHFPLPTLGKLDATRASPATVNDLSFRGAPPMRVYKPTRFPDGADSFNLTLGPMEDKVVLRSNQIVSTKVMPLFLRADHRIADAQKIGRFLAVVREILSHPNQLELSTKDG